MKKSSIPTLKSSSSDIQHISSNNQTHRFFILRHGETDANANGIMQGSADFSRLTANGRSQAKDIGEHVFSNNHQDEYMMKPTSVYVSPLTRSQDTLQIIKDTVASSHYHDNNFSSKYTVLDNLREIDFYDWEGMQKEELISQFPVSYRAWDEGNPEELKVFSSEDGIMHFPLIELWERAGQVWAEIHEQEFQREKVVEDDGSSLISHPSSSSLVVCHGSLGQALLGVSMGWDASSFRTHEFPNCGLIEIECQSLLKPTDEKYCGFAKRWRWYWPQRSEWNTKDD